MKVLGRHLLAEMWACDDAINRPASVRRAVVDAAAAAGATLLDLRVHRFRPHGVTAFALLAESHLAIHTWPEHRYAAVDLFTCGARVDPEAAMTSLQNHFRPQRMKIRRLARGLPGEAEANRARAPEG